MKATHTIRPTVPATSTASTRRRNSATVSTQPPTSNTQATIAAGCAGSSSRVPAACGALKNAAKPTAVNAISANAR